MYYVLPVMFFSSFIVIFVAVFQDEMNKYINKKLM